jgi:hypothetical protein
MGNPMGRHPLTHYIHPKIHLLGPQAHKTSEIPRSQLHLGAPSLQACRSPKSGQTQPMFPQNLVEGQ